MKNSRKNWNEVSWVWEILFRLEVDLLLVINAPAPVTLPDGFFRIRFVAVDFFVGFQRANIFNEHGLWQRADVHT